MIDGNGQGIIFSGGDGSALQRTRSSRNNLITNSKRPPQRRVLLRPDDTPAGRNNLVRDNCIHNADGWYDEADGSGIASEIGFDATNNVIADPRYIDRAAGDFGLEPGSPCAGVLEGAAAPQLSLEAVKATVGPGQKTILRGRAPRSLTAKVWIFKKVNGNWQSLKRADLSGSFFKAKVRVHSRSQFKARAQGVRDSAPGLRGREQVQGDSSARSRSVARGAQPACGPGQPRQRRPEQRQPQPPGGSRDLDPVAPQSIASVDPDPRPGERARKVEAGGKRGAGQVARVARGDDHALVDIAVRIGDRATSLAESALELEPRLEQLGGERIVVERSRAGDGLRVRTDLPAGRLQPLHPLPVERLELLAVRGREPFLDPRPGSSARSGRRTRSARRPSPGRPSSSRIGAAFASSEA